MPWKVFKNGEQYCVYNINTEGERIGESLGCHERESDAEAQVRALYAREGGNAAGLHALVARDVLARGDKGEQRVTVLIDTGAGQSFIVRRIAAVLGTIVKLPHALTFTLADGRLLTISEAITLALEFAGEVVMDTFLVMESGVEDVILGESTMRKHRMKIDLEHGTVYAAMRTQPCLSNLQPTKPLFKSEDSTMQRVIARLRELFSLGADASEEQILAKLDEQQSTTQRLGETHRKTIAVLGVREDAPQSEIEGALAAAVKARTLRANLLAALGLDAQASDEAIQAAVVTAKNSSTELPKLAAKVAELEAKEFERTFAAVIDKAFNEGKILPVTRNDTTFLETQKQFAKSDPAGFAAFWERQPVIGPVKALPLGKTTADSGLDAETLAIAKQLGVDEATLKKYNKEAA
jgi:hypothetical protein